MERIFDTSITIGTIRKFRTVQLKGVMPAGTGMAKYQYIISGDNTMTQFNYNYNSREVASKLIKCASTALLMAILEACDTPHHEDITEQDRQELAQIIDEVA